MYLTEQDLGVWRKEQYTKDNENNSFTQDVDRTISEFFRLKEIEVKSEPIINIGGRILLPDFYLTQFDHYYEHFRLRHPEFISYARDKIELYRRNGIKIFFTTYQDEFRIGDALLDILEGIKAGTNTDRWPESE